MKNKYTFSDEFYLATDVFEKKIYPDVKMDGLMCKIHDAFGSNKSKHHNCLGCNLDTSTHHLYMFLTQKDGHNDLELSYTNYVLLMYLAVVKVETVLEIIGLPEEYKKKHFHIFQKIKKWANFIKHPKAFVLCHHPEFYLENDPDIIKKKKSANVIIDNAFVYKFYSDGNNNKELFKLIANKDEVIVELPNVVKLTEGFCEELNSFVKIIANNEVYRDILNDKSTIENYFTEEIDNNLK